MALKDGLLNEMNFKMISTRKMLERVPFDKFSWKPHDKSMDLGGLARHIANLASFPYKVIENDVLDMAAQPKPQPINSTEELVARFDENWKKSLEAIKNANDNDWGKDWALRNGDQVIFSVPRKGAIRGFALNHLVHHRGQLSVYLRLLNIAIPSIYGPSADEAA